MSILSEQERDGLEDIFLSLSKTRFSPFKWSLSHYHCYWTLNLKESIFRFSNDYFVVKKNKKSLKWTIFQKNYQKIEKHR